MSNLDLYTSPDPLSLSREQFTLLGALCVSLGTSVSALSDGGDLLCCDCNTVGVYRGWDIERRCGSGEW